MIDIGLLLGAIVAVGVPMFLAARWGFGDGETSVSFIDLVMGPLLLGLVVARLAAVLLEDPGSIRRISELMIIRSGVEFWPGVIAAAGLLGASAWRSGVSQSKRLAAIGPLALIGAAGFEATCVVRDGCFGPDSPIGLRPSGVLTTMLPIGWLAALALAIAAMFLQRRVVAQPPSKTIVASILVVATVRAIASFWLPHVGAGLTRPHKTSIAVAVAAAAAWLVLLLRSNGDAPTSSAGETSARSQKGADREEGRRRPPPDRRPPF